MIQFADNPALHAAALYIALLALGIIPLAVRVIRIRRAEMIGIGDGGNRALAKAIRVHANYTEYAPFGLALLLALPLAASPAWSVHLVGLSFVIGRAAHAVGLSQTAGASIGRAAGMVLTFGALVTGAIMLLWRAIA